MPAPSRLSVGRLLRKQFPSAQTDPTFSRTVIPEYKRTAHGETDIACLTIAI